MAKIIAIGGGSLTKDTLPIDKEIIKLSDKKSPKVLFIPTATGDSEEYTTAFRKHYEAFNTDVDLLLLFKENYTKAELEKKIFSADIIYVGGGNTLRMMKMWRRKGVDKLLIKAYQQNKVLAGVSAGAICWFFYGHSDSRKYSNAKKWIYIKVRGLGLCPFFICPHVHAEGREKSFTDMVKKINLPGIGIDNCAALEIVDDTFRIIKAKPNAEVFLLKRVKGQLEKAVLIGDQYKELSSL